MRIFYGECQQSIFAATIDLNMDMCNRQSEHSDKTHTRRYL